MSASNTFLNNPFVTRDDTVGALKALLEPLAAIASPGGARIKIGHIATHYDEDAAQLEGFARPLWALASLLDRGCMDDLAKTWMSGFENGPNPESSEYWGQSRDKDQRMVEMSPIGFALATAPHAFWEPLSDVGKKNLIEWLTFINTKEMPNTNWLWFRIFANLGLRKVGAVGWDADRMKKDLDHLDTFYIGGGWSRDGPEGVVQLDYYSSSFAIHVAQLLYAKLAGEWDSARAEEYRSRARQFAMDFVHYFDPLTGHCVPFGRSMVYRFAAVAFWSAVAYTEVELPAPLSLGVVKGIVLRHLRWWSKQPAIFKDNGTLNIGYTYENQFLTENYNSPGSPYWCCKAFFIVGLPADHKFWTTPEEEYPTASLPAVVSLPKPSHIVSHVGRHQFLLSSGQACSYPLRATQAKYGKFAYSSAFGFSVPTGGFTLEQFGPDSMLSLSDDGGDTWHLRRISVDARIETFDSVPVLVSKWFPWKDVEVETYLIPPSCPASSEPATIAAVATSSNNWHIRAHRITAKRDLMTAEGGFAIYGQGANNRHLGDFDDAAGEGIKAGKTSEGAVAVCRAGASGIACLAGGRRAEVMRADSNSNYMENRTVIPMLSRDLTQSEAAVWYVSAVFAVPTVNGEVKLPTEELAGWEKVPEIPGWLQAKMQEA